MKKLFLLLFFVFFFFPNAAGAFNDKVTHRELTAAALSAADCCREKLNDQERGWILKGVVEEDAWPRPLNHFYDPQSGRGLNYSSGGVGLAYDSVLAWALGENIANEYSAKKILENYRAGRKREAFAGIGHIVHLIQDMAVPAHTRNDPHLRGDPFESWAYENGIVPAPAEKENFYALGDIFKKLASLSHFNFFSQDTVDNIDALKFKEKIEIIGGKTRTYYLSSLGQEEYKAFYLKNPDSILPVFGVDGDASLQADYWRLLSPQAVGLSAAAIDYFLKQFALFDAEKVFQSEGGLVDRSLAVLQDDLPATPAGGFARQAGGGAIFSAVEKLKSWPGDLLDYFQQAPIVIRLKNALLARGDFNSPLPVSPISGIQPSKSVSAERKIVSAEEKNIGKVLGYKEAASKAYSGNEEPVFTSSTVSFVSPSVDQKIFQANEEEIIAVQTKEEALAGSGANIIFKALFPGNQIVEEPRPAPFWPLHNGAVSTPSVQAPVLVTEPVTFSAALPETSIVGYPPAAIASSSALFSFSSSIPDAGFECRLNSGAWSVCASSPVFSSLSEGDNLLEVRAVSAVGHDQSPAVYGWAVDSRVPDIFFVVSPPAIGSSTEIFFQLGSSESGTVYKYQLDAGSWETAAVGAIALSVSEGEHFLSVQAEDPAGNKSEIQSFSWQTDLTAPASSISGLESFYNQSGFPVAWSASEPSSLYDVEYRSGASEWQALASATSAESAIFSAPITAGETVYFRTRALDPAGNTGAWSDENVVGASARVSTGHLVISAVQVAGATADDEFVELYNPTEQDISLSAYKLKRRTASGSEYNLVSSFGEAKIAAHSYFLIAHPVGYQGSEPPDAVYSSASYALASGNTVILYNDGVIVDLVGTDANSLVEKAPAPSVSSGQALKRKSAAGATASSVTAGADRWQGSAYDTDDNANDFLAVDSWRPKSASSPVEPLLSAPEVPSAPAGLTIEKNSGLAKISWLSPENGNLAPGAKYDLRYLEKGSGDCALNINWSSAVAVAQETLPLPALTVGVTQMVEISGLQAGGEYCFSLRVYNGLYWSALSEQKVYSTKCPALEPIFTGNLEIRRDIASRNTDPLTAEEPILIFDYRNSLDQGGMLCIHADNDCYPLNVLFWGDTEPATRLIVEAVYNADTRLFTGQYRFCTDSGFNPNNIVNEKCRDGRYWSSSRWFLSSELFGKSEITVFNSSQYAPWQSP